MADKTIGQLQAALPENRTAKSFTSISMTYTVLLVVATERPKTMSDYRDAIIDMCKKYAVPYVDTMTYSGLNPDNTSNYNLFYTRDDTGDLDIVHVNHLAHQRIARVVGEVLNQLVLWNSDIVR